ncbi:MAG: hypothetical protein IIT78_03225 [Mycoplasmataceae bacterium]|nr:hypothetical protein [Mycoplasmataceae bacterium]
MNSLISISCKIAKKIVKFVELKTQDKHEIIATNVTYLLRNWDAKQNHFYFSGTISHKAKEILDAKLLPNNDTNLVIDSFELIKDKQINNNAFWSYNMLFIFWIY